MSNEILVLGSTGKTGRRITERLQSRQVAVRAGSRHAALPFHWEDPSNWAAILQGIDSVYISFQPDLAVPGAVEKIALLTETARACKVRKLVLLSGRGEKEAQACEQVVMASGLAWTIVRASWFMQNFSENFLLDSILAGEVVLPPTHCREPFVDVDDIADVVVAILTSEQHNGKIYELTGPELLTFRSATGIIADVLQREIVYTEIPMEAYLTALRSYQLPDDFIWLINYLFTEVLDGRNESLSHDIETILQRKPGSFYDYAVKVAKAGIWKQPAEEMA